jgi:antirestriction protein ArdC
MKQQDIYEQVTNRIIAQLEQGVVPWKSPYFSKVGFPRNFSTGKRYQGINVFLLASLRFTSPYFLTYIQAQQLGGNVRKGEKGSLVIKYGTYTKEIEGTASAEESEEHRKYLKGYTVFHASQIEGITFPEPEGMAELPATAACDRARALVAGMPNPPKCAEGSAVPCYRPKLDIVDMPIHPAERRCCRAMLRRRCARMQWKTALVLRGRLGERTAGNRQDVNGRTRKIAWWRRRIVAPGSRNRSGSIWKADRGE